MLVREPINHAPIWVKVIDFGLAKAEDQASDGLGEVGRQTDSVATLGTPRYMAPEQFGQAKFVDGRADTFSLGVILYELLAGRAPYRNTSMSLHETPAPSLARIAPAVSAPLLTLVHQMISRNAADRPLMSDVVLRIEELQAQVTQPNPSIQLPRHPWTAMLVGAALLCALGIGTAVRLLLPAQPSAQKASRGAGQLALGFLERLQRDGSEEEQVIASGILLGLGHLEQQARLLAAYSSGSPLARRLAVNYVKSDVPFFVRALADSDRGVRVAAARRLAEAGRRTDAMLSGETAHTDGWEAPPASPVARIVPAERSSTGARARGWIRFVGKRSIRIGIDARPLHIMAHRRVEVSAGRHTIHFAGGDRSVYVAPLHSVAVYIPGESPQRPLHGGLVQSIGLLDLAQALYRRLRRSTPRSRSQHAAPGDIGQI